MTRSSFATVQLARFDQLQSMESVDTECTVGEPLMWAIGADESAAGVEFGARQAFNHRGEVNWLEPQMPGQVFSTGPAPDNDESFVVITSAGWRLDERFDPDRASDFGLGVLDIRNNMTAVEGLHSQHSFNFTADLTIDAVTLTYWHDDASMRAFAYRPGRHKTQLDKYREFDTADRTSFTRLRVIESRGSVNGSDPMTVV